MKIKIIQADTRPLRFYLESKNLVYTPIDAINLEAISQQNGGLLFGNDGNSLGVMINVIKSKLMGCSYEFIEGQLSEWEQGGTKSVPWIKIRSLLEQFANPDLSECDVFVFLDTDAWIRDEQDFLKFCETFLASPFHLAIPRDIEMPNYTYLNSGFLAVKNTSAGKHILETVYSHPDYRTHEKSSWWEQSELSTYQSKHPDEIMVLPLNDFNTPCGRIVRHCWVKHIVEPFAIQDLIACFSKLAMLFTNQSLFSTNRLFLPFP